MIHKLKSAKTLKGWKTVLFNGGAAIPVVLDIVGQLANSPEIMNIIPEGYMKYYGLAVLLINIGLRYITTTPVGKNL